MYENKSREELIEEIKELKHQIEIYESFGNKHEEIQKTLWEKNTFLSNIIESSSTISIISTDIEGKIIYWNSGAENIFGYSAEEIVNKKKTDILYADEDALSLAIEIRKEIFCNKQVIKTEIKEITKDGKVLWINMTLSPRFDKDGEVIGILGIGQDVTEKKQAEIELQESMEKMETVLESTIFAIESTLEVKDPYTSGHQRKVAQIAKSIATELGFSKEQIEGIYLAATIHDIGKIAVPVEILCKPGKISEIEFNLIKIHPQIGFDILKNIEFPWPIAKIIQQHHERYNGTGYPSGLKGDQTLIESRIIAIADVIEAMASHRPYRPALGIELALEEITQKKGILYDPKIVDVCLKLFNQKKLILE